MNKFYKLFNGVEISNNEFSNLPANSFGRIILSDNTLIDYFGKLFLTSVGSNSVTIKGREDGNYSLSSNTTNNFYANYFNYNEIPFDNNSNYNTTSQYIAEKVYLNYPVNFRNFEINNTKNNFIINKNLAVMKTDDKTGNTTIKKNVFIENSSKTSTIFSNTNIYKNLTVNGEITSNGSFNIETRKEIDDEGKISNNYERITNTITGNVIFTNKNNIPHNVEINKYNGLNASVLIENGNNAYACRDSFEIRWDDSIYKFNSDLDVSDNKLTIAKQPGFSYTPITKGEIFSNYFKPGSTLPIINNRSWDGLHTAKLNPSKTGDDNEEIITASIDSGTIFSQNITLSLSDNGNNNKVFEGNKGEDGKYLSGNYLVLGNISHENTDNNNENFTATFNKDVIIANNLTKPEKPKTFFRQLDIDVPKIEDLDKLEKSDEYYSFDYDNTVTENSIIKVNNKLTISGESSVDLDTPAIPRNTKFTIGNDGDFVNTALTEKSELDETKNERNIEKITEGKDDTLTVNTLTLDKWHILEGESSSNGLHINDNEISYVYNDGSEELNSSSLQYDSKNHKWIIYLKTLNEDAHMTTNTCLGFGDHPEGIPIKFNEVILYDDNNNPSESKKGTCEFKYGISTEKPSEVNFYGEFTETDKILLAPSLTEVRGIDYSKIKLRNDDLFDAQAFLRKKDGTEIIEKSEENEVPALGEYEFTSLLDSGIYTAYISNKIYKESGGTEIQLKPELRAPDIISTTSVVGGTKFTIKNLSDHNAKIYSSGNGTYSNELYSGGTTEFTIGNYKVGETKFYAYNGDYVTSTVDCIGICKPKLAAPSFSSTDAMTAEILNLYMQNNSPIQGAMHLYKEGSSGYADTGITVAVNANGIAEFIDLPGGNYKCKVSSGSNYVDSDLNSDVVSLVPDLKTPTITVENNIWQSTFTIRHNSSYNTSAEVLYNTVDNINTASSLGVCDANKTKSLTVNDKGTYYFYVKKESYKSAKGTKTSAPVLNTATITKTSSVIGGTKFTFDNSGNKVNVDIYMHTVNDPSKATEGTKIGTIAANTANSEITVSSWSTGTRYFFAVASGYTNSSAATGVLRPKLNEPIVSKIDGVNETYVVVTNNNTIPCTISCAGTDLDGVSISAGATNDCFIIYSGTYSFVLTESGYEPSDPSPIVCIPTISTPRIESTNTGDGSGASLRITNTSPYAVVVNYEKTYVDYADSTTTETGTFTMSAKENNRLHSIGMGGNITMKYYMTASGYNTSGTRTSSVIKPKLPAPTINKVTNNTEYSSTKITNNFNEYCTITVYKSSNNSKITSFDFSKNYTHEFSLGNGVNGNFYAVASRDGYTSSTNSETKTAAPYIALPNKDEVILKPCYNCSLITITNKSSYTSADAYFIDESSKKYKIGNLIPSETKTFTLPLDLDGLENCVYGIEMVPTGSSYQSKSTENNWKTIEENDISNNDNAVSFTKKEKRFGTHSATNYVYTHCIISMTIKNDLNFNLYLKDSSIKCGIGSYSGALTNIGISVTEPSPTKGFITIASGASTNVNVITHATYETQTASVDFDLYRYKNDSTAFAHRTTSKI